MENILDKDQTTQKTISFVHDNKFYILGEFDESLNWQIIAPLTKRIEELATVRDPVIDIYINSPGGLASIMWHIVGLMERAKKSGIKVRTIVTGEAFSAASMTAVAGTPGERYIDIHSEHLPHYGTAWGFAPRTPLQGERISGVNKRHFRMVLNHYKKYAAIPDLESVIKDDLLFIPASKCLTWKLADKYLEEL